MKVIKAKKKFGQNFLNNLEILQNISNLIDVQEDDLILEIGPGMGALTNFLVAKKSFLLAYEIDSRMKEYLSKMENSKVHIIYDDFLKRNFEFDIQKIPYNHLYVISNIPYYITSPIIIKLIESELKFDKIVLLVQKEVAQRLTADYNSKDYNAFTLYVDFYYQTNYCFTVDRNNFIPCPNVDSAVVLLERKDIDHSIDPEAYFKFIKEAFQNKRKILKNNIKNYDMNRLQNILKKLNYSENVRAEEISKEDFKKIFKQLFK